LALVEASTAAYHFRYGRDHLATYPESTS